MADERVTGSDLPAVVHGSVEKAIRLQHSVVAGYVQRLRRRHPTASPADLIAMLEKQYLSVVTGAGAVLGGTAAVPGAGTGLAVALSAGETALVFEATAFFTLAVAEVHAVRIDDIDRRRELVMTVVLGDGGAMLMENVTKRTGERWEKLIPNLIPMSTIGALNKALCRWVVTKYPSKYGIFLIGKLAPFGIGAGVGAAGSHVFGRLMINTSRQVFGPPPTDFDSSPADVNPDEVMVVESVQDAVTAISQQVSAQQASAQQASVATSRSLSNDTPAPGATPSPSSTPSPREASVTGKYRPLFDHLAAQGAERIDIGISKIDKLVPGGLPKSAATRTWWGNSPGSRQATAWLEAGYEVTDVDFGARTVRFAKRGS